MARVLLMDEGRKVTRILAKRLAQAAAADGKEALDAIDACGFSLVLMDGKFLLWTALKR